MLSCLLVGRLTRTGTKTKVEVVNTQKGGNLEVENRVSSDGSSASTKFTVKNLKFGTLPPVEISGQVTKDQNGQTTKGTIATGSDNVKVGASLEISTDKNGDFWQGKAGIFFQYKRETSNGTTIKSTTTVGKIF